MAHVIYIILTLGILIVLPGCPVALNRVAGDTELLVEAQTGEEYYLYVPSWHNNENKWPVVVTCHGTWPYDSAWAQIREWRALAERYGLLIIAPKLKGTDSIRPIISSGDQVQRQREDEQVILNAVRKTIASLNGDPDRVYMVGWSGGGYTAYYTGLRNPKIFRAMAIRMGSFDEDFLPDVTDRIDPYQPVFIYLAAIDLPTINAQCRQAYHWLVEQGMERVSIREVVGAHERKPGVAFSFFKDITDKYAFIRVNAVTEIDGDPLKVQFYCNVHPEPIAVVWEFGDGKTSFERSPQHQYSQAGTYRAKVTVVTANSARTQRKLTLEFTDKHK